MLIPFNKPHLTGKEVNYIYDAVTSGQISGNGKYSKMCHKFFEQHFGFKKCLLTTSCTDALEMAALLCDIKQGDEVIIPSYTFVSTALAFVRQGAKIIFADSRTDHPGMDEDRIEELVTSQTKAIVVVHYAGVSCDMDKILSIANKYNLFVIEDAAQAIDYHAGGGIAVRNAGVGPDNPAFPAPPLRSDAGREGLAGGSVHGRGGGNGGSGVKDGFVDGRFADD